LLLSEDDDDDKVGMNIVDPFSMMTRDIQDEEVVW